MVIAIDGKWLWDSWYIHDGERWHGYFLQADRSLGDPDLRHFNVTQGHATSTELVTWDHKGTTFRPAEEPAWADHADWLAEQRRAVVGQAWAEHAAWTADERLRA